MYVALEKTLSLVVLGIQTSNASRQDEISMSIYPYEIVKIMPNRFR